MSLLTGCESNRTLICQLFSFQEQIAVLFTILSQILSPAWHYKSPQQVRFVEKLSDVVISQLPNFWKLWISYVNGSLFSEVDAHKTMSEF